MAAKEFLSFGDLEKKTLHAFSFIFIHCIPPGLLQLSLCWQWSDTDWPTAVGPKGCSSTFNRHTQARLHFSASGFFTLAAFCKATAFRIDFKIFFKFSFISFNRLATGYFNDFLKTISHPEARLLRFVTNQFT